jgi:hypothetical protein
MQIQEDPIFGPYGDKTEAQRLLKEWKTRQEITLIVFALLYLDIGNKDLAFQWLDRGIAQRSYVAGAQAPPFAVPLAPHIFSSSYGTFHREFTVITCRAAALPAYVRLRWPARGRPPKGESI